MNPSRAETDGLKSVERLFLRRCFRRASGGACWKPSLICSNRKNAAEDDGKPAVLAEGKTLEINKAGRTQPLGQRWISSSQSATKTNISYHIPEALICCHDDLCSAGFTSCSAPVSCWCWLRRSCFISEVLDGAELRSVQLKWKTFSSWTSLCLDLNHQVHNQGRPKAQEN